MAEEKKKQIELEKETPPPRSSPLQCRMEGENISPIVKPFDQWSNHLTSAVINPALSASPRHACLPRHGRQGEPPMGDGRGKQPARSRRIRVRGGAWVQTAAADG